MDTWDYEYAFIELDSVKVWGSHRKHYHNTTNFVGHGYGDSAEDVDIVFPLSTGHGSSINIYIGTNLNEAWTNEAIGIDDVFFYVHIP